MTYGSLKDMDAGAFAEIPADFVGTVLYSVYGVYII